MINDKGILIHNIFYMLSYAFQELKKNNYAHIDKEDFENILDLLAEILYRGVSEQLKKGLYREYIEKNETLSVLRGRLDINGTIRNIIQHKNKLYCEYDELSENNLLNQIIKSTLLLLVYSKDVKPLRKKSLRSILLFFSNVDKINLRNVKWNAIRFQRNNISYQMLITLCYFIVKDFLLTTNEGEIRMMTFSEEHMNKLFERFVLNYYKRHYPSLEPNADAIVWNVEEREGEGLGLGLDMLPSMQSDITLHFGDKTHIIDTKYYGKMMQSQYEKKTIYSANMYQIFTYVKNKDIDSSGNVSGMLLYARTQEEISPNVDVTIGGNRILVNTLDLNSKFDLIASQLNNYIHQVFPTFNTYLP